MNRLVLSTCAIGALIVGSSSGWADIPVATSASYSLEQATTGAAGAHSTSGSFFLDDTAGQPGTIGQSTSGSFRLDAGFWGGVVPDADLSITKDDGVTATIPGGSTTYTIVASNNGPGTDAIATVTDTFPAELTCSWTSVAADGATGNTTGSGDLADTLSMPPGSSVTYTADCAIDPGSTGLLSNTAIIASSVSDPDRANNSATDIDTVPVELMSFSIE